MSEFWDRLRAGLPVAVTSAVVLLGTFGSALGLKYVAGLPDSVLVLAVVLAVSLSRRQPGKTAKARMFALVALPLVSVGATEVGSQVSQRPNLGDALFVLAVSASVWSRRFRGPIARLGSVAGLPLIAILIAPAAMAGSSSGSSSRWWAAVVAVLALAWVTACFTIAERRGWLPVDAEDAPPRAARPTAAMIDRMALRMLVSLTLAFVAGRWLFGAHWPWLVITAFVVSSGGAEHADVWWRGVQRVIGAGIGTLGATLVTAVTPAGSAWSIVAILGALMLAAWLRPVNYAFWAAGVTSVLALLYGYYGERGGGLLTDRLEEIALGAALAITVSWLVTLVPMRKRAQDPLRAATLRVLGYVNRQHGLTYQLVGSLPSGGYLVRDARGEAVLHWSRDRTAAVPDSDAVASDAVASGATPSGHPYALAARRD